jgi:hypothetical protein
MSYSRKIALALILSTASFAYAQTDTHAQADSDAKAVSPADKAVEDAKQRGKQLLLDEMTDPDSTKFRNVFLSSNGQAVCGEYNSKNQQGGYAGFTYFFAIPSTGGVGTLANYRARRQDASDFARVYNHNCK